MLEAPTLINWDEVDRFTPELYEEYCAAPIWEIDSPDFSCEADYMAYWCAQAQAFVMASKAVIGRWQQNGKMAAQAIERSMNPSVPVFDFQSALAEEALPVATAQVHEKVALLSSNPPRPIALPQQEAQGKMVSALNQLMEMVFEDNNWPLVCAKAHYDVQFWNTTCLRWNIDPFSPGLFGQKGKISLDKVTPDDIYFDPKAKDLDCRYMDYCVQRHVMEVGEIQSQYPMVGALVSAEADEVISDTSVTSRNNEDYVQSPQPKLARDGGGRRQKITVFEVWVKDSRLKFEPKLKDPNASEAEKRYQIDSDGYLIGDWVKRYPDGRCLIVTGNVVLKDLANPLPHGQFPFVFPIGGPASVPYATGDALRIMVVTRKLNNMISLIHRYYQSEGGRPMHMESGAIMDPNMAQQIPNDPSYVLELAPGKGLVRPPAVDLPPLIFTYVTLLQQLLDQTSGSSGVMRGNVQAQDQLSAEAIGDLNSMASSRVALEQQFFNAAVRQLGYQLMWILRGILKQSIKVTVTQADGTPELIDWESDRKVFEKDDPTEIRQLRATEDYLVTIKSGTGKPGGADQQQAQALELYRENAIDREALLDTIQFPGRQAVISRIRNKELEDIKLKATAKELGVGISETIKQDRPGRRKKA